MVRKWLFLFILICGVGLVGCSDEEATTDEVKNTYELEEVNGNAVEVLQGIKAVEVKREGIPEASKDSKVMLKVEGKQIELPYNKDRDSFRNPRIKDVELEKLEKGTISVKR